MPENNNLPSYEQQFGEMSFKKGDDARSVYSPAAYLADLLQLLDGYFGNPDINAAERRPDLKNIPLDAVNTFSLIPYLDIVNELLEKKIRKDPAEVYKALLASPYPFNHPFNLDNAFKGADSKTYLFSQHNRWRLSISILFLTPILNPSIANGVSNAIIS